MQTNKGMIQIFTGNGKGKTTAALGTLIRAAAKGKKVGIIYFDKGGEHYSERKILFEKFPEIDVVVTGLERIDSKTGHFRFGVIEKDKMEARRGLAIAGYWILKKDYDLVVLDEINTSISLGMLEESLFLEILKNKPARVEIICTGRSASDKLKEIADLVTEMKLEKHYFYQGVPAREGIDF